MRLFWALPALLIAKKNFPRKSVSSSFFTSRFLPLWKIPEKAKEKLKKNWLQICVRTNGRSDEWVRLNSQVPLPGVQFEKKSNKQILYENCVHEDEKLDLSLS